MCVTYDRTMYVKIFFEHYNYIKLLRKSGAVCIRIYISNSSVSSFESRMNNKSWKKEDDPGNNITRNV